MSALVPSRNWELILAASLVVLFAILTRSGSLNPVPKANEVSIQQAIALIDSGALVIDVREGATTRLPGALLIPLEVLGEHLSGLEAAKARPIVVYCGNGTTRGPRAAQILTRAGFTRVANLKPGIEGWRASGLPVAAS